MKPFKFHFMKSFEKNRTFTTEKYIASQADRLINTWNEINYSFQQSNTEKSRLRLAEWPSGQSNPRATCATGTKYSILLTPAGVPVNISVGRDGHLLYPTLYSGLWLVDQYMRWNIYDYHLYHFFGKEPMLPLPGLDEQPCRFLYIYIAFIV